MSGSGWGRNHKIERLPAQRAIRKIGSSAGPEYPLIRARDGFEPNRVSPIVSRQSPAPAKINLFLAVTGRRADGFHDLVSVVAPLVWGDTLEVEPSPAKAAEDAPRAAGTAEGPFELECSDPAVPRDGGNLVLKAARAFAEGTGWTGRARFILTKRIPVSSGLGGGSSDAATALLALNRLSGGLLDASGMAAVAARVGSDCPLFLHAAPVAMRGRGERLEPLPPAAASRLRGRRVLVFKPGFGIATSWAYGRLAAAAPGSYVPASEAENRLRAWIWDSQAPAESLLFNSMEPAVFGKFAALPALLGDLRRRYGLAPMMSGSGSACFALLGENTDTGPVVCAIRDAWGPDAFLVDTRIA